MGGSNIYSVSKEEASQWAEKHLESDEDVYKRQDQVQV